MADAEHWVAWLAFDVRLVDPSLGPKWLNSVVFGQGLSLAPTLLLMWLFRSGWALVLDHCSLDLFGYYQNTAIASPSKGLSVELI